MGHRRKLAAAALAAILSASAGPAFAAADVDALLRQDGFEAEHPGDGFWTIWFNGTGIGDFQVCLVMASNGRNLVAFVPLIDQPEILPDAKLPLVRLLEVRDVHLTVDKVGRYLVYDVVPSDRINALAVKNRIETAASDAIWAYGELRPYLSTFRKPMCIDQPSQ